MVTLGPAVRRWSWAGLAVLGLLGVLAAPAWMRGEPPPGAVPSGAAEPAPEVINLTRVSYKVKPATAEAISALLKDNVKSVVLEIKSEGDTFTVTTTPDAQHVVGQFIALLQGKPLSPAPGAYWGPPPGATWGPGGPFGPFGPGPGGTGLPNPGGTGGPFRGPGPGGPTPSPGGTAPSPGR